MSDVNQQGKSVKVAVCKCQMPINKEKVLKLRYVYSDANRQGKEAKVAVCICQMPINKEKVLKLRYAYVRCQSTRKTC